MTVPAELAKALAAVQVDVAEIAKNATNQHARYDYATVDQIYEAVRPLLGKHGLTLLMHEVHHESGNNALIVDYACWFVHESGATPRMFVRAAANAKMGSQAYGAAQAYASKMFLRRTFCLATGDPDLDAEPQEPMPQAKREPSKNSRPRVVRKKSEKEHKRDEVRALLRKLAKAKSIQAACDVAVALANTEHHEKWDMEGISRLHETLGEWAGGDTKFIENIIARKEDEREAAAEREAIQEEANA